jgi:hypothetical protein
VRPFFAAMDDFVKGAEWAAADAAFKERINEVHNVGHGHVRPRSDGVKARCGGPAMCRECAVELVRLGMNGPAGETPEQALLRVRRVRAGADAAFNTETLEQAVARRRAVLGV